MRTVILFLAAARVYGFAAVMEHPHLPSWMPQAPSSWKLPGLKLLARVGGTGPVLLWYSLEEASEIVCRRYS